MGIARNRFTPEQIIGTPREAEVRLFQGEKVKGISWIDRPYAGSLVPIPCYKKDFRVNSIMIELNRTLYMNEFTGEKIPALDLIERAIQTLLGMIGDIRGIPPTRARIDN